MADAIAVIEGQDAFAYSGAVPWHKKGTSLAGLVSGKAMLKAAKLDWTVIEAENFYLVPGADAAMRRNPAYKTLLRSVDGGYLSTVKVTYPVINQSEVAEYADALLGEGVEFETGGALYDGRVIFLSAMVPDRVINIPGDISPILPRIILTTGHDSLHAFRIKFTPERTVCANTLSANLKGVGREVVIRHTKTWADKVEKSRKALGFSLKYFDAFEAMAQDLSARPVTLKDVLRFTEKLIPVNPNSENAYKTLAQRDEIVALYRNAANLAPLPETAYRLYNAVGEYADHVRTYRDTKLGSAQDARALAVLDGTAQKIKDRALALLVPSGRSAAGRFVKASAN